MISPGGNILYFHDAQIALYVPHKVACTSIKQTMANLYMMELGQKNWKTSLKKLKEGSYTKGYYKIAVVRNPWDRVASLYTDKVIDRNSAKPRIAKLGMYSNMPFDKFVKQIAKYPDSEELDKHFKSQYLTIFRDGNPDSTIKFEQLSIDWQKVQQLFLQRANKKIPKLPQLNKSSPFEEKWTDESINLIKNRYIEDVEFLDYKGPSYKTQ